MAKQRDEHLIGKNIPKNIKKMGQAKLAHDNITDNPSNDISLIWKKTNKNNNLKIVYSGMLENNREEDDMSKELANEMKKISSQLAEMNAKIASFEKNQLVKTDLINFANSSDFKLALTNGLDAFASSKALENTIKVAVSDIVTSLEIPNSIEVERIVGNVIEDKKITNETKVENIVNASKKSFLTYYASAIVIIVTTVTSAVYYFSNQNTNLIIQNANQAEKMNTNYTNLSNQVSGHTSEINNIKKQLK